MIASLRRALVFLLTVGLLSAGPASIGSVDTCFGAAPLRAQSSENSKYAAIVVDAATGEVLFARHADRVRMTNIAQMVNVLQAMILTRAFDQMRLGHARLGLHEGDETAHASILGVRRVRKEDGNVEPKGLGHGRASGEVAGRVGAFGDEKTGAVHGCARSEGGEGQDCAEQGDETFAVHLAPPQGNATTASSQPIA